ncbi:MAG: 50S ribosomal protein L22 [Candidatus Pacebacteria bacterium]|nr:50S ribosomal protein L22 [Candidatus Paceibacterota bacterium]
MKAYLSDYRQSPRKVRLVADLIKGKSVVEAQGQLSFMPKKASGVFSKLLASAVANAKNVNGLKAEDLMIKEVRVDGARVLKRSMPRARGSAFQILKRNSHVLLVLGERGADIAKVTAKIKKEKATPKK